MRSSSLFWGVLRLMFLSVIFFSRGVYCMYKASECAFDFLRPHTVHDPT